MTNKDIRLSYLQEIARIGKLNEQWLRDCISVEERARRAYQLRHDARLAARRQMKDPRDVEALEARDRRKYGNPDGPTYTWLVENAKRKGLEGEEVFEYVVATALETNTEISESLGL